MGKKNTIRKPLNIGKGAETPKAIARSEMDDKESQKGKVSAKDLFKAIQFAEIKQRIKSPTCLSTNSHQSTLIKPWQICQQKLVKKNKVLLQAIFLHDLVDWTNTSLDEIKEEFGASVASVVGEVTSVDKVGKEDLTEIFGEKASKEAVNGLSKNGKLW